MIACEGFCILNHIYYHTKYKYTFDFNFEHRDAESKQPIDQH